MRSPTGRFARTGRPATSPGRAPFAPCTYARHWFTRYSSVGERAPFCQRCGSPNPTCVRCTGPTELVQGGATAHCKWCGHEPDPTSNPMRRHP